MALARVDRRRLVLGAGLLAGALLTQFVRPRHVAAARPQEVLDEALPPVMGGWQDVALSEFVLPPRNELETAAYDGQLLRAYRDGDGLPIYCVIAYGAVQDYALQLHRPEVCYPSSGYTIERLEPFELVLAGANVGACLMIAQRGLRREAVLFWTRVGAAFPRTQWQVRREILAGLLHGELPDGALVRLSTPVLPNSAGRMASFARAMAQAASPQAQRLLFRPAT